MADFQEYPEVENGYICVSVFTCGEKGAPIAALNHFISLLDVKDENVKCFNSENFKKKPSDINVLIIFSLLKNKNLVIYIFILIYN